MINKEWDPNLTPEQNYVLKQEGTESPGSSHLNNEKNTCARLKCFSDFSFGDQNIFTLTHG